MVPACCEIFKDTIYEDTKNSSYGMISTTSHGIQTIDTLVERYKMLDEELTARGIVRSESREVVEMTDGHKTRGGLNTQRICKKIHLRQYVEEADTSGIFAALDQYNKKFHVDYNAGKKYLRCIFDNQALCISNKNFMRIFCLIWFSWSSPLDRVRSFSKVGITNEGLRPDLIDRSNFFVPIENVNSPEPSPLKQIGSPEDIEEGEDGYFEHKYNAALQVIAQLKKTPYSAAQVGVLKALTCHNATAAKRRRMHSDHGSYRLRGMLQQKEAAKVAEDQKEADKLTRKETAQD